MSLFTHSYCGNSEAQFNPFNAYIEDALLIKTSASISDRQEYPEVKKAEKDGFVFATWINVFERIALYVKPSTEINNYRQKAFAGYSNESLVLNFHKKGVRAVLGVKKADGMDFRTKAIAGDIDKDEFFDGLTELLKGNKHFPLLAKKFNIH